MLELDGLQKAATFWSPVAFPGVTSLYSSLTWQHTFQAQAVLGMWDQWKHVCRAILGEAVDNRLRRERKSHRQVSFRGHRIAARAMGKWEGTH